MSRIRNWVVGASVWAMLAAVLPAPALAAVVGTEQMVRGAEARADRATVDAFMAREDVREQLVGWGVAPQAVEQRLASLSDAELRELALKIEHQPAGGDLIAVIGIVFIVLLILELVGVTNVFTGV